LAEAGASEAADLPGAAAPAEASDPALVLINQRKKEDSNINNVINLRVLTNKRQWKSGINSLVSTVSFFSDKRIILGKQSAQHSGSELSNTRAKSDNLGPAVKKARMHDASSFFYLGYDGCVGNFDAAHDDGCCFFYGTFGYIDDDASQFVVQFVGVFQLGPDAVHIGINGFRG